MGKNESRGSTSRAEFDRPDVKRVSRTTVSAGRQQRNNPVAPALKTRQNPETVGWSISVKTNRRHDTELPLLKGELTTLVLPPAAIAPDWYEDDMRWTDRLCAELKSARFKLMEGISPKACMVSVRCLNWCTLGEAPSRPLAFARALKEFAAHPLRRALLPRATAQAC